MIEFKTIDEQLEILAEKGLIIPKTNSPRRFLEQENYYDAFSGYKKLFLIKDPNGNPIKPEQFLPGSHFNEIKALYLFDRDLRMHFLKYLLIFESSFKTVYAREFSSRHEGVYAYLEMDNYAHSHLKQLKEKIDTLKETLRQNAESEKDLKVYIAKHRYVPLWVLVNYLTSGEVFRLFAIVKNVDKRAIIDYYALKYKKEYKTNEAPEISIPDMIGILKIMNFVRNRCAHDERLYDVRFQKKSPFSGITDYLDFPECNTQRLILLVLYLKIFLDKKQFKQFCTGLKQLFKKYRNSFKTIPFDAVLDTMGINEEILQKLK